MLSNLSTESDQAQKVTVKLWDDWATPTTGVWTGLGAISTISHGLFAAVSAPLWLLVGIPATVLTAASNKAGFAGEEMATLWQFGRYPQGLPLTLWNCPLHPRLPAEPAPPAPPAPLVPPADGPANVPAP